MIAPDPAFGGAAPITMAPGLGLHLVTPPPDNLVASPIDHARVAEYDALNFPLVCLAENLADIERTRIAMGNRLASLAKVGAAPSELRVLAELHDGLSQLEHEATLSLQRAMRGHPLAAWVKRSTGVGEKQAARLLAAIGNPYWNSLHDRPRRGPMELWAYCGYHVLPASQSSTDTQRGHAGGQSSGTPTDQACIDPHSVGVGGVAAKRRKGERANWNANAKMRARLVAESCVKQKHHPDATYAQVYADARAHEEGRTHDHQCSQCGVCDSCGQRPDANRTEHAKTGCLNRKVRRAEPGDPLKAGHEHARALRKVAKVILKDVYLEAKRWHDGD